MIFELLKVCWRFTILFMDTKYYRIGLLFGLSFMLGGCLWSSGSVDSRVLKAGDFVSQTVQVSGVDLGEGDVVVGGENVGVYRELPGHDRWSYVMDAIVGHMGGEAVYASEVFEPFDKIFKGWSEEVKNGKLSRREFLLRVEKELAVYLDLLLINKLMYVAALRDLPENYRLGVDFAVRAEADRRIRKYGNGSRTVANKYYLKKEGQSFEKSLNNYRRGVVMQEYIRKHVLPKVHVTKKDIRLAYHRNREAYQFKETYQLNLIMSGVKKNIEEINKRLKAGVPFLEIAKSELNTFNRDGAGAIRNMPSAMPKVLAQIKGLHHRVGSFTAGVVERGEMTWAYIRDYQAMPGRSLEDMQLIIKANLRKQQEFFYTRQLRNKVRLKGNYSTKESMLLNLMSVAKSRYMPSTVVVKTE